MLWKDRDEIQATESGPSYEYPDLIWVGLVPYLCGVHYSLDQGSLLPKLLPIAVYSKQNSAETAELWKLVLKFIDFSHLSLPDFHMLEHTWFYLEPFFGAFFVFSAINSQREV